MVPGLSFDGLKARDFFEALRFGAHEHRFAFARQHNQVSAREQQLAVAGVASGQTFGSIDGEARDASGAAVAGVMVSATNKGTNATRTAITNDAGSYSFPSLAPASGSSPGYTIDKYQIVAMDPMLNPLLDPYPTVGGGMRMQDFTRGRDFTGCSR